MQLYCKKCDWIGIAPTIDKPDSNLDSVKASCPKCGAYIKWLNRLEWVKMEHDITLDYRSTFKCHHTNLVPHTVVGVKETWETINNKLEYKYIEPSNMINAHFIRVTTYYCPSCKKLIDAPKKENS